MPHSLYVSRKRSTGILRGDLTDSLHLILLWNIRKSTLGFPRGPLVKNPPTNTGDTGSSFGLGSHMPQSNYARAPQLLSLHSTAYVPQLLSPRDTTTKARAPRAHAPQQEKPPQWEASAMKSSPCSPQLEKAHTQQRRPNAAKNK